MFYRLCYRWSVLVTLRVSHTAWAPERYLSLNKKASYWDPLFPGESIWGEGCCLMRVVIILICLQLLLESQPTWATLSCSCTRCLDSPTQQRVGNRVVRKGAEWGQKDISIQWIFIAALLYTRPWQGREREGMNLNKNTVLLYVNEMFTYKMQKYKEWFLPLREITSTWTKPSSMTWLTP